MDTSFFLVASFVYFIIWTLISLNIYFGLKYIEKSTTGVASSTAKLHAYQKITGIWQGSLIFWLLVFYTLYSKRIDVRYNIPIAFVFSLLFFWFYLTRFRKKTIELTEEIKKDDPKTGNFFQFMYGFSKNSGIEMLKLFVIIIFGLFLILVVAEVLIKYNLI